MTPTTTARAPSADRPGSRPAAWTARARRALAGLAVFYVALCALMYGVQRHLLFHPTPATAAPFATLARADGTLLRYAEHRRDGEHALLYFGGNAENPSGTVRRLAQAFPGHAVYGLHYRGYAGSDGAPSEAALRADAVAWFTHLRARHPRLTLVGRSLGSGLALRLAAEHGAERLVLVTPYDSIATIAAGRYPWLPVDLLLRDRFDAWHDAPRVQTPTLLLLAEHDEVIPPASSRALLRHFRPGIATLRVMAGTDHNSIGVHPDYLAALRH